MIEELKQLVALVNTLPQLALWVAIGFWAYKVIIVGSIYGVIRMVVTKVHDWLTRPKPVMKEIGVVIADYVWYGDEKAIIKELARVLPANKFGNGDGEAVKWLSEAITAKIEKDGPPKK